MLTRWNDLQECIGGRRYGVGRPLLPILLHGPAKKESHSSDYHSAYDIEEHGQEGVKLKTENLWEIAATIAPPAPPAAPDGGLEMKVVPGPPRVYWRAEIWGGAAPASHTSSWPSEERIPFQ
uniref:Uncharacterized protein n=1 Tax=Strongyloides papillosus TaxID=174720 RepID=A0A0N5C5U0_STREA